MAKSSKSAKTDKTAKADNKAENAELKPAEVVRAFIAAMHDWEKFANKTIRVVDENFEDGVARVKAAQDAIFQQFCTPKPRTYGRHCSYSKPPEYQPDHESILEVTLANPRRAEVHTQQGTGFKHRRKYILLLRNGQWLIDSVKCQAYDDKWNNGVL